MSKVGSLIRAVGRTVFLILALVGGAQQVMAADDDLIEVFIDARQEAYVVFQGVAQNTSGAARQEMAGYANLDNVSLVGWAQFRDNVDEFIAAGIVNNEYPGVRTGLGLLAILKSKPGRPVAITWNGGIATSFFDFQHAVDVFEDYQEDRAAYEKSRAENSENDPLNPDIQIRTLLGG